MTTEEIADLERRACERAGLEPEGYFHTVTEGTGSCRVWLWPSERKVGAVPEFHHVARCAKASHRLRMRLMETRQIDVYARFSFRLGKYLGKAIGPATTSAELFPSTDPLTAVALAVAALPPLEKA